MKKQCGERGSMSKGLELGRMKTAQPERCAEKELGEGTVAAPGEAPGLHSASNGKPLGDVSKGVTRSHLKFKR